MMLVGVDAAGPLKLTPTGNQYFVIAIDYFSKFAIARAVPNITALTTAKFIFEDVVCR